MVGSMWTVSIVKKYSNIAKPVQSVDIFKLIRVGVTSLCTLEHFIGQPATATSRLGITAVIAVAIAGIMNIGVAPEHATRRDLADGYRFDQF